MTKNILVINAHPDPRAERFCAALSNAYVEGASQAGHQIRRIDVGALDFPLIRTHEAFASEPPPAAIREAQEALVWADHLVMIFPLWQGGAPAVFKGFLEQVFRYGVAMSQSGAGWPARLLKGKSARLIVTMGMPAPIFRVIFGGYGLKSLERGVLWLSGFRPVRHTIIGKVEAHDGAGRLRWLKVVRRLGGAGL